MPDLETPITTTEQLQEQINASLAERLQRERDKFKDYDDLKKFKADSEATLTAANSRIGELEAKVQDLTGSLSAKEIEVEKTKVAAAKKVPAKWITGSTVEEMEKSADEWLADAKSVTKPGVIPSHGGGDPNVKTSPYEAGRERAEARYGKKN